MGKTRVRAGHVTLQNILFKGGGESIKLHASTKNVILQLQGVDQSDLNYISPFLRYMVRNTCMLIFVFFYLLFNYKSTVKSTKLENRML
jgi:hypothetical protein